MNRPPPPPRPVKSPPRSKAWAGSPERIAWAQRHGVSPEALEELARIEGTYPITDADAVTEGCATEGELQAQVVMLAPHRGYWLSRNNVGMLVDEHGTPVRFGLCNRTKDENKRMKSSDLIGFRRLLITQKMVGSTVAQFAVREVKKPGWHYTGKGREVAQKSFIDFVNANGGDAAFACDLTTFDPKEP